MTLRKGEKFSRKPRVAVGPQVHPVLRDRAGRVDLRSDRYARDSAQKYRKTSLLPRVWRDLDELSLLLTQAQTVPAQLEFDRIAQGCPTDDFYGGAVAEPHFEQAPAHVRISADAGNGAVATDAERVQRTRIDRPDMIAARKFTRLLHRQSFSRISC